MVDAGTLSEVRDRFITIARIAKLITASLALRLKNGKSNLKNKPSSKISMLESVTKKFSSTLQV